MNQRTNRHQRLSFSLSHVVIVSLSAIFLFGTLSPPSDSTRFRFFVSAASVFPLFPSLARLAVGISASLASSTETLLTWSRVRERNALSRSVGDESFSLAVTQPTTILMSAARIDERRKSIGDEREFTLGVVYPVPLSDSTSSSVLRSLFLRLVLSFSLPPSPSP